MSDTVKLVVEMPKAEYERLAYIDSLKLKGYVESGKLLDDVLDKIKSDVINIADGRRSIPVRSVIRIFAKHRESEDKGWHAN